MRDPAFGLQVIPVAKGLFCSLDQHRVAEGEEAVFLLHGDLVGRQYALPVPQGRDQHDQRAAGQVEVGDQRVHQLEAVAGLDEDAGVAPLGHQPAVLRGGFQRAHAGGAHGDDPPAPLAGGVDPVGGLRGDLEVLRVHLVFLDVLHLHRPEGAQAHVQQHRHDVHALLADAVHQLRA